MEKIIGKYKIKFSGDFSDKTDKLSLNVKIDDGLKAFLKGCVAPIEGTQKVTIDIGSKTGNENSNELQEYPHSRDLATTSSSSIPISTDTVEFKRYLIKTPISSSINYIPSFEVPFITDLIDGGKLSLDFNTFSKRDKFKDNFKQVIKKLLEISNNEKVDETVTFNIKA